MDSIQEIPAALTVVSSELETTATGLVNSTSNTVLDTTPNAVEDTPAASTPNLSSGTNHKSSMKYDTGHIGHSQYTKYHDTTVMTSDLEPDPVEQLPSIYNRGRSFTDQSPTFDDDDPLQSHHSTFVLTHSQDSSVPFESLGCTMISSGEDAIMSWLPSIAIKPLVSGEDLLLLTPKFCLSTTVMSFYTIATMAQHPLHVLLSPKLHQLDF